jgi:hypothetical protein
MNPFVVFSYGPNIFFPIWKLKSFQNNMLIHNKVDEIYYSKIIFQPVFVLNLIEF